MQSYANKIQTKLERSSTTEPLETTKTADRNIFYQLLTKYESVHLEVNIGRLHTIIRASK